MYSALARGSLIFYGSTLKVELIKLDGFLPSHNIANLLLSIKRLVNDTTGVGRSAFVLAFKRQALCRVLNSDLIKC